MKKIFNNKNNIGGVTVLVGSAVFKTVVGSMASRVGSIPIHLRQVLKVSSFKLKF